MPAYDLLKQISMGNCVTRKKKEKSGNSSHFTTFQITPISKNTKVPFILRVCKKRRTIGNRAYLSIVSLMSRKNDANSFFDYEKPLSILFNKL